MKAIHIHKDFNDSLIEDIMEPQLDEHQSLLNVKAVGICQSDIARVFNQSAYYYPIVLGHEFSGYTHKGKATIFPIIPCMNCSECSNSNYAQCHSYSYYGSRQSGGMQERLAVNNWNLIYGNLDYEELALTEPCAVAVNTCNKIPDNLETVLVNGCGFIGMVAIQVLLARHKKVFVLNRNQEKLKFALDHFDVEKFNGDKVDCAIDFVSNSQSTNLMIDSIRPHGRLVTVGNPSTDVTIAKNSYSQILRKELNISGVWNSRRDDWFEVIDLISNKSVDVKSLITHRYDYKDFKKAFENMRNNQVNHNELVIKSMILF